MPTNRSRQTLTADGASQQARERRLLTVKQFAAKHPCFKVSGLRWQIHQAKTNGLAAAIVRLGRNIYIDETQFWEWVDGQNGGRHG